MGLGVGELGVEGWGWRVEGGGDGVEGGVTKSRPEIQIENKHSFPSLLDVAGCPGH